MRLGYFTMPVHPLHRDPLETLREDREAIILADRLGFHDAFVGEHLADKAENITNSLLFLATLIHSTKTIKLATGTTNLSQAHPVLVAVNAAMFDHLAAGRFILGVSPGALPSDAEALGILGEDRNRIFAEAIDVILAIWERDPPYDIDLPGNRFKVTTRTTHWPEIGTGHLYKPYQRPRPEIVGTVVAPSSKGVIAMGERDFHPLSANFLLPHWLPSHWANYAEGARNAGRTADPADWRIARTVFVADDDKTAAAYGRLDPASPYRFYYHQIQSKLTRGQAPRGLQGAARPAGRGAHAGFRARPARHLRRREQGRRRDPRLARAGRRLRRAGVRRHRLGRSAARATLDGADGDRRHAARERGDRALAARRARGLTGGGRCVRALRRVR